VNQKGKNRPVVLITGTSNKVGKSLCEVFHAARYRIIGIERHKTRGMPDEILNFDIGRLTHPDDKCESFCRHVEELVRGRLDSLVNNSSVRVAKPVEKITAADWKKALDVNLLAPFWLIRRFLPLLKASKGSVVNILSIHAVQTKPEFAACAASEGALISLTRSMAVELGPEVRVNAVVPAANEKTPPSAGEIARTAHFLSGPDASSMTGAIVNVDNCVTSSLDNYGSIC